MSLWKRLAVCLCILVASKFAQAGQETPARPQQKAEKKAANPNARPEESAPFVPATGSAKRTSPVAFGAGKNFAFFNGSPLDLVPKEKLECFDVMGKADATQEIACKGAGRVEVWVFRSKKGELAAKSNSYLSVCRGGSGDTRVIESTCDPVKFRAVEAALKAGNAIDPGSYAFVREVPSGGPLVLRAQLANVKVELSEFEEANAASASALLNTIIKKMPVAPK